MCSILGILEIRRDAAALREGGAYTFKTSDGDEFTGNVILANPPLDFAGTIANMNNSILRIAHETCFGKPEAFVFLSTWGVDEDDNKKLEGRLQGMLKRLFT